MRRHLIAFIHGIRDGWEQPHDLTCSWNTEHLWVMRPDGLWDDSPQNSLDRGINFGQFLRAGHRSEAWRRGFWPFTWRRGGES